MANWLGKWQFEPLPGSGISSDSHFDQGRMFLTTIQNRSEAGGKTGEAAIIAIGKRELN